MPTGTAIEVCPVWNKDYKSLISDTWAGPAVNSVGCKIAQNCVEQIEHHSKIRCIFSSCEDVWTAQVPEKAPLVLFCTRVRNAMRYLFEEKMETVATK